MILAVLNEFAMAVWLPQEVGFKYGHNKGIIKEKERSSMGFGGLEKFLCLLDRAVLNPQNQESSSIDLGKSCDVIKRCKNPSFYFRAKLWKSMDDPGKV